MGWAVVGVKGIARCEWSKPVTQRSRETAKEGWGRCAIPPAPPRLLFGRWPTCSMISYQASPFAALLSDIVQQDGSIAVSIGDGLAAGPHLVRRPVRRPVRWRRPYACSTACRPCDQPSSPSSGRLPGKPPSVPNCCAEASPPPSSARTCMAMRGWPRAQSCVSPHPAPPRSPTAPCPRPPCHRRRNAPTFSPTAHGQPSRASSRPGAPAERCPVRPPRTRRSCCGYATPASIPHKTPRPSWRWPTWRPPAAMAMFAAPAPISTMTWSVEMLGLDAPASPAGWTLLRSTAQTVSSGYATQVMELWDEQACPLMISTQCVAVFT